MDRMRSPENRAGQRAARRLEEELKLKYLSPGAFTILSPHEYGTNPDPPTAPTQYRLTPTSTRRRIQAFSIIAEASSNPGSRSPSPTGRVSPFRGRGFNPIGSRHASPNPSPPPPEEQRSHQPTRTHTNHHHHPPSASSPRRSQIPQPTRKGSTSNIFGDHVTPEQEGRSSTNLSPQFSQSMTNMTNISGRKGRNRRPAFEQLSPITGSSPETTSIGKKSQSSPSRIPMSSRSQPVSRRTSPSRGREYSNQSSRAGSRSGSRNNSRSSSPSKGYSRIPVKNSYKDVSAKVNTFNLKTKPKVPPKPQELKHGSSGSSGSSSKGSSNQGSSNQRSSNQASSHRGSNSKGSNNKESNNKGRLSRKASEVKLKPSGGSGTNLNGYNRTDDSYNRSDDKSNRTDDAGDQQTKEASGNTRNETQKSNSSNKSSQTTKSSSTNGAKLLKDQNIDEITVLEKGAPNEAPEEDTKKPELQSRGSSSKLDTTVVSSTTKTAVQPLRMDEDLENSLREERSKAGYLSEDRILSATSVSNAMNKMNDSVLNSQTLLGDQNFGMRSPANTIISMSNDHGSISNDHGSMSNIMGNKVIPPRSAATTLPTIESIHKQLDGVGQNINSSFSDSNKVHMESIENTVKNNITKANTPDHVRGYVQKSVNDRIIDARTLVTSDVKPIKILVKGRPEDVEVQSGNTRLPSSATNGLSGSPSLPPAEVHQNATNQHEELPPPKTSCCGRFFSRCKCKKPLCKKWKKKKTIGNDTQQPIKKSKSSLSCFNCRKKKKKQDEDKASTSTAPIEGNEPTNQKPSCWNRLKCCKSKRVGDTGCCPRSKRKDSWVDNRDSIRKTDAELSKPGCKNRCKNVFRSILCCACCACCVRKKEVEVEVRRASMISSKKKSLTPTAVPPVDTRPKIDISLVEHGSVMKGAIPVLPVPMAWICLICNIFLPGIGTVLSGMFCLCVGKPRFSQNDGPRPRIGAFIIDLIIGCGQLFTVLFCLVGWGWSIWWGVIMLKVAKKHKRIKLVEARAQGQVPVVTDNHRARDPERGS